MARRGDELVNPATGLRLLMRQTAAETGGRLLEMEAIYAPHSPAPPAHLHPRQEEHFTLLAGAMRVRIAGQERRLAVGDTLVIPPGTPHTMWNEGEEEARVCWQTRPALHTATYFETLCGLARDGRTDRRGIPRPLQLALLLHAYRDEMRLAGPPAPLQRLVLGLLGAVGRLRGYRAAYPRYSADLADAAL